MIKFPKSISAYNLKDWINSGDEKLTIIDVREKIELEIASFPNTDIHIPMSKLTIENISKEIYKFKDTKIVVLCHMGIRSYNFCTFLLDNHLIDEVWNLEEGIDGWSKYIDPTITRY